MAQTSEIDESNRQIQLAWESFAVWDPKGETVRYPGVTAVWCHAQWPLLNAAFIASPVKDGGDLERRIQTAVEHGQKRQIPWILACCREWLPSGSGTEVLEILNRYGLHEVMVITGMVTEDVVPPARAVGDLELRPVADVETRRAVADINALSYELPLEWGREVFEGEAVWRSNLFGCVGYVEGKAVATATTAILEGIRYVALVATLPEFRHRGHAEAVMRQSLEMARRATGIKRTVLHATPMGKPSYERMGYGAVAAFGIYMLQH
jgi:GNAT superfamily N-acetyltransferase